MPTKLERFYSVDFEQPLIGSEFHHLTHSLRLRQGDEIELVNGNGSLARARIERLERSAAHFVLLECTTEERPSPSLLLGLPLIRLPRLEWAIEKGTELGADAFYLFPAHYSKQTVPSPHSLARLRTIAIASMKQCKRLYLPELIPCNSLSQVIQTNATILFGDPTAHPLNQVPSASSILFLTGPEGGFAPEELNLLQRAGARGIKLHRNILRVETAPLVALALLQKPTLYLFTYTE